MDEKCQLDSAVSWPNLSSSRFSTDNNIHQTFWMQNFEPFIEHGRALVQQARQKLD